MASLIGRSTDAADRSPTPRRRRPSFLLFFSFFLAAATWPSGGRPLGIEFSLRSLEIFDYFSASAISSTAPKCFSTTSFFVFACSIDRIAAGLEPRPPNTESNDRNQSFNNNNNNKKNQDNPRQLTCCRGGRRTSRCGWAECARPWRCRSRPDSIAGCGQSNPGSVKKTKKKQSTNHGYRFFFRTALDPRLFTVFRWFKVKFWISRQCFTLALVISGLVLIAYWKKNLYLVASHLRTNQGATQNNLFIDWIRASSSVVERDPIDKYEDLNCIPGPRNFPPQAWKWQSLIGYQKTPIRVSWKRKPGIGWRKQVFVPK